MNKSPWIKLWVSDIVASCSDMSAETFGIHMRMILYSWDRGYCPSDTKKLKAITNFKHFRSLSEAVARWKAVRIPSVSDVVLIHPRVEEERQKMLESSQKMTERSQKANEVRWKKPILVGSHGGILNRSLEDPMLDAIAITNTVSITPNTIQRELITLLAESEKSVKKQPTKSDHISWSVETSWVGINDIDRAGWHVAFPAVNIEQELQKMTEWLISNPTQARKRLWRRFLTNWLSRSQERGGTRQNVSTAFPRNLESNF